MDLHGLIAFVVRESKVLGDTLASLSTSSLGQTLVGTAVSAFAGVMGAHWITERFKRREQLLKELRVTNAAIMTSFEICNSMLGLKKQYVKELAEGYAATKADFERFEAARAAGEVAEGQMFFFETDFRTLNPMLMPHEVLMKQVYEDISSPARAYMLTGTLVRSIDTLNRSITSRNEIIEAWKKQPAPRDRGEENGRQRRLISLYFGRRHPVGHVDLTYPNLVEAIAELTDDCIQFSYMLCLDLVEHGERLRGRLGRRKAPAVNQPDFAKARENNLMPNEEKYRQWMSMFVKNPKRTRFSRLCEFFHIKKAG